MEIIPAILENNWQEIERKIELVKPFIKTIHIDVIDGKFAENPTFLDPEPFIKYTKDPPAGESGLFFEVHLMVEEPVQYLKLWAEAGFKRFFGQIEKMSDQVEFVAQGELLGEVGLAIDGPTSLEQIKVPLNDLDSILAMIIKAGASGQTFVPEYLEKIKELRKKTAIPITVDGGINNQTIIQAKNYGATRFLTNSFLFKGDPYSQFQTLQNLISKI